ncbi:RNA polymerase sigma-70 factor, ECF subfamily [Neorhodopirellula lusitana]|uniref:RNA polymerase sigma-70 factor, ECF subfamily n=1 Tax=Neorhodopirellula lusitana TaxID=445327 RepID=A0ABY1PX97_9BACT|nr:sigma-70 family RNA polymerase sigma factor [Neorhodopirellula lusitana]SMP51045.1 RNA polymerase sigma-70 factor, ECF subfamily [Neorhodopirellula lusitana]
MKNEKGNATEFVRLLTGNQRMLFCFIHTLVPRRNDVDEILQETNLVLWREFDKFEIGSNFHAWACSIARNQVRAFTSNRRAKLPDFDTDTIMLISTHQQKHANSLDSRIDVLEQCIAQLPRRDRLVLDYRYRQGAPVGTIACEMDLTVANVYKLLSRIRMILRRCVDNKLSIERVDHE